MANKKISDLTPYGSFTGSELFELEYQGASYSANSSALATLVGELGHQLINVKDYGAVGDGVTDDTTSIQNALNAVFPTQTNSYTSFVNQSVLWIPPGDYQTTGLHLLGAVGAVIIGGGKASTRINNTVASDALYIDGAAFCEISGIYFETTGSAVCLDLDCTNTYVTTQGNTIRNCAFQGSSRGIRLGVSGTQTSENLILNCHFFNQTVAGLEVDNFNALQQTVIGGNFQSCAIGISVNSGSAPVIEGVGFQGSTSWDIQQTNSGNDIINIIGCRTESLNFLNIYNSPGVNIIGCNQINASAGTFMKIRNSVAPVRVEGCNSENGNFDLGGGANFQGRLAIKNFSTGASALFSPDYTNNPPQYFDVTFPDFSFIELDDVAISTGNPGVVPTDGYMKQRLGPWGTLTYVDCGMYGGATLTDAATISWNPGNDQSESFNVTINGSRTLGNVVAGSVWPGRKYSLDVQQGSSGGPYTLSYGNLYRAAGGTFPTLSTAANAVDKILFQFDGTYMNIIAFNKGMAT